MKQVPLAQAKARLSEIVQRAAGGEPTQITVRGKPMAQIVAPERASEQFDWDALRRLRESMPMQTEPAGEFIRKMRDEERY